MKICLINPPIEMSNRLWYPIGICYVASYLLNAGHKVEIIDIIGENLSRENFKKRLSECPSDCFGIGGLIMAFNNVIDITTMIREMYPESFIFAGNTVGYTIPEILLHNSPVNAIVMGEGEITAVDLVRAINIGEELETVKGIAFINQKGDFISTPSREPIEDLDILLYPAWHLVPMENYFKNHGRRVYPISSVRGCPFNCVYCCKTYIGYKVRSRSPENIMEELIEVNKQFEIDEFIFFDDLFLYNKQRALKFCDLKSKSQFKNMKWLASARANSLDEELCNALSKTNCDLGIGFESLSQEILDFYKKGIKIEQYQKAINICRDYGFDLSEASSFLIGAPNETHTSVKVSVDFCKKNGLRYEPHFVTPYPKTPLYDYALQKGLIKNELEYIKKVSKFGNTGNLIVNLTENFSDDELIALREQSVYFPFTPMKDVTFYFNEGVKILKKEGIIGAIIKAENHCPRVFEKIIRPILHPKQEKYSNEWV